MGESGQSDATGRVTALQENIARYLLNNTADCNVKNKVRDA